MSQMIQLDLEGEETMLNVDDATAHRIVVAAITMEAAREKLEQSERSGRRDQARLDGAALAIANKSFRAVVAEARATARS